MIVIDSSHVSLVRFAVFAWKSFFLPFVCSVSRRCCSTLHSRPFAGLHCRSVAPVVAAQHSLTSLPLASAAQPARRSSALLSSPSPLLAMSDAVSSGAPDTGMASSFPMQLKRAVGGRLQMYLDWSVPHITARSEKTDSEQTDSEQTDRQADSDDRCDGSTSHTRLNWNERHNECRRAQVTVVQLTLPSPRP